jgi:hypothetical protein
VFHPASPACRARQCTARFCIRRQAGQRRKRLQLGTGDLFDWAERAGFVL